MNSAVAKKPRVILYSLSQETFICIDYVGQLPLKKVHINYVLLTLNDLEQALKITQGH